MASEHILNIEIVEGKDLLACDSNGTSDPFVVVLIGKRKKKTSVVWKSLSPKWNESFAFNLSEIPPLITLRAWDKDKYSADDRLGMIEVRVPGVGQRAQGWHELKPMKKKDEVSGALFVRAALDCELDEPANTSENNHNSDHKQNENTVVDSSSASSASSGSSSSDDASVVCEKDKHIAQLETENKALREQLEKLMAKHSTLEARYQSLEENLVKAKLPGANDDGVPSETVIEDADEGTVRTKFTAEQIEIAKMAFERFDDDGNGSIDRTELLMLLQQLRSTGVLKMGDTMFRRYVDNAFASIDVDRSGSIEFEELLDFLYSPSILVRDVTMRLRQMSSDDLLKRKSVDLTDAMEAAAASKTDE
jgi:Ca2+-binding EF-hand superfamily protein